MWSQMGRDDVCLSVMQDRRYLLLLPAKGAAWVPWRVSWAPHGWGVYRAEAGISGCAVSAMDKGRELGTCPGHSGGGEGNGANEEGSKALKRGFGPLCSARQRQAGQPPMLTLSPACFPSAPRCRLRP